MLHLHTSFRLFYNDPISHTIDNRRRLCMTTTNQLGSNHHLSAGLASIFGIINSKLLNKFNIYILIYPFKKMCWYAWLSAEWLVNAPCWYALIEKSTCIEVWDFEAWQKRLPIKSIIYIFMIYMYVSDCVFLFIFLYHRLKQNLYIHIYSNSMFSRYFKYWFVFINYLWLIITKSFESPI